MTNSKDELLEPEHKISPNQTNIFDQWTETQFKEAITAELESHKAEKEYLQGLIQYANSKIQQSEYQIKTLEKETYQDYLVRTNLTQQTNGKNS